jgi:nucleotide-binding universal stress UspA family protein
MSVFSRPQVALSLTEPDRELLRYAGELGRMFAWQEVHFAHVAPKSDGAAAWDASPLEARMRQEVEQHFGRPTADFRAVYHAAEGARLDQLLNLAAVHSRDLVVMGHRAARSGRRSLARRMAMISPASIWLVPEGSPAKISRILVPTDFSIHSADALKVAVEVGRAANIRELHAVHIFFDPSTIRYDEHVAEVVGQEESAFRKFIADIDTQGIRVEPTLQEGTHPAHAILRVAERHGSDLIVMNTRGRSNAASVLLGSVTSDTMAATHVPLLAVKHFGAHMSLMQALLNHHLWDKDVPKTN